MTNGKGSDLTGDALMYAPDLGAETMLLSPWLLETWWHCQGGLMGMSSCLVSWHQVRTNHAEDSHVLRL